MAIQYSIQKMVSDGTLSTIALGIQYLQRNDIYIRIAGEDTPQSGAHSGYTWSFLDNTTLKILPVVPNGVEVVVYRRTDVDAMYNIYSQNAQFDEATIDENNQQLLYIAQEYLEQGIPGAGVDTIEYVRDDGSYTHYRIKRTDGSYSDEFTVPSAGNAARVIAREAIRRSYANAGYNLVSGSFQAGFVLVNTNDVALDEVTGKAFSGAAGTYPAGTNTSGFTDRSNTLHRVFRTIADLRASTDLTVDSVVTWHGYYVANDGGGNTGVVRAGTPPYPADGGSIFVISPSLYIEADMRWPTIRQFGGGTDGDTGITPAKNLAAMNAILAYATKTGKRVYAGTVKTMSVSAGVKVTLDGALDFFGTKSFKLKWSSNADHLVEIMTPAGVSKSGLSLYRLNTDGGRYGVYARAGKFGDNLLNVIDDISITYCKAQNSYLAGHYVYHGQNVDVSRNFYHKCGDNGPYVVFSRFAQCTNNLIHNCRGSAGVVMGYSDTVVAKGLLAANNIIWNDADSANVPTASASTTLGGVWMGHCDGGIVCNNEIYNHTKALSVPIKSGIWIDENSIRNVKVFGNHITNMSEHNIVVGITANSKVYDVEITNNTTTGGRDGVRVYRGGDVHVKGNNISFTTQRGVTIAAGVKNAEVVGNKFKCCCQQETFNTFYVIENLADRAITMRNEIDDTFARINLVDPSGTVTVKVDPANTNIDVFVSGVLTNSLTVVRGTTLWSDVHAAIIAIPQLSGSTFTGNPDQEVVSIKRTGGSTESWAVEEPADGYILSFSPPLGYIKQTGGVCRDNKLLSNYLSCKVTAGNMYDGQKCNALTNVVDRDTNNWGGGRSFIGTARPTTGYYRQGDTVSSKLDGGSFSERCTVSGYPGTWVAA